MHGCWRTTLCKINTLFTEQFSPQSWKSIFIQGRSSQEKIQIVNLIQISAFEENYENKWNFTFKWAYQHDTLLENRLFTEYAQMCVVDFRQKEINIFPSILWQNRTMKIILSMRWDSTNKIAEDSRIWNRRLQNKCKNRKVNKRFKSFHSEK